MHFCLSNSIINFIVFIYVNQLFKFEKNSELFYIKCNKKKIDLRFHSKKLDEHYICVISLNYYLFVLNVAA